MIALVLALLTVQAAVEKPQAVAIGCKKQKLVGRALADELALVTGAKVNALVRRQRIDSKTREGLVAIAEAFEVDLLVRCTKGQGRRPGMLEVIDADGTILSRRPLKMSRRASDRRLFGAWLRAGVRDALAASAETVAVRVSASEPAAVATSEADSEPQPIATRANGLETTPEIGSTPQVEVATEIAAVTMIETAPKIETAPAQEIALAQETAPAREAATAHGSATALETTLAPEADRPIALLLLGGSLREKTLGAELTLRTRLLRTSSLEAELTTGVDRDRTYRFLFTAAYLFELFGAGFGPSIALGLDPNAPASDRIAHAGAILLIPLVTDALALRMHGGYRPITSKDLTRVLGHGYIAGGSIEGSFDGGFSYALRADYQAVGSEHALGFGALIGWRF